MAGVIEGDGNSGDDGGKGSGASLRWGRQGGEEGGRRQRVRGRVVQIGGWGGGGRSKEKGGGGGGH